MKTLYFILSLCLVGALAGCEPKQEVIYTGVSSPYFDGTVMDYLRSNEKNWDLTVEMIERAGLEDLFEGKVDTCPEITFFAPPAYSIQRFIWESQEQAKDGYVYESVADIPVDSCRSYILRCVAKGKFLKGDIGFRNESYRLMDAEQDGGTLFQMLDGNWVRACEEKSDWKGVPDIGPVSLQLWSVTRQIEVIVASPDIQPTNGVVHALHYGFDFGKI